MNCPNCKIEAGTPRRCPNCGHRLEHNGAVATAIVLSTRKARALMPQPPEPTNVVEFPGFDGKAVQS